MRIAWNVRVAGSMRVYPLRGIARLTMSARRPVVSISRVCRASTIARATRRA